MDQFRVILFWVFISFFVVIGIASLLVQLGFIKKDVDDAFRKWALRSFIGAVTLAIVGLFKILLLTDPTPQGISVGLMFPTTDVPTLEERATYHYMELDSAGGPPKLHEGGAITALEQGSWQVQLPPRIVDKAIAIRVKDTSGHTWVVDPFYPNHIFTKISVRLESSAVPKSARFEALLGISPVFAAEPGRGFEAPQRIVAPRFTNYARPIDTLTGGRRNYEWRIFVDEGEAVLKTIRQVDYLLHASFPQPFRTSTERSRNFELVTSGWGTFTILINVHYIDGRDVATSYELDFNKGWPAAAPAVQETPHRPFDQAFKDGVFQARSGNWRETAALMREAIAGQPTTPPKDIQLERKLEGYAPYSYLALASLQMQPSRCDEARNALSQSGLEKRSPWLVANLEKARLACSL